jgi:2-dehydro-3-deoxyphosphogluconate aldolase/(4S)-4-hydroxy-2-oxoglutarate aldolase
VIEKILERILEIGIIPVVRASSAELALSAARAICAGGIPIIEMTMTVPGAIKAISELKAVMGDHILIGAGTVLDAGTAAQCIAAGAEFIVSPGFDPETVKLAHREEKPAIAGALTPTEIITAWKSGSDLVKVFPCGNVGGPNYLSALKSALPQIPMVPTGGVNLANAARYLEAGAAALGVGGELISAAALKSGDLAAITTAARQFVDIVKAAPRTFAS